MTLPNLLTPTYVQMLGALSAWITSVKVVENRWVFTSAL